MFFPFPSDLQGARRWLQAPGYDRLGEQRWRLQRDSFEWNGQVLLRYRGGFQFDGASAPWPISYFCRPGDYLDQALPHDQSYGFHWVELWNPILARWERVPSGKVWTDMEFDRNLDLAKKNKLRTALMVGAVGGFGWPAWWSDTCNVDHDLCPDNAGDYCPYRNNYPPESTAKSISQFVKLYMPKNLGVAA